MLNISQLESSLWEAADQLRANSKLNANEYSMPVLGLIFLRHATNRFNAVQGEIEKGLPSRGGKKRPITKDDFNGKSAIFLQAYQTKKSGDSKILLTHEPGDHLRWAERHRT
jgi:type I restriction enzyme M protein